MIDLNPHTGHPNPNMINRRSLSYDISDTRERNRTEEDHGLPPPNKVLSLHVRASHAWVLKCKLGELESACRNEHRFEWLLRNRP